jgi:Flp pilus assembly protein TadD
VPFTIRYHGLVLRPRRLAIPLALCALLASIAALTLRVQPGGKATVIRNGSAVHVQRSRVGVALLMKGSTCLVPKPGDALLFQQPFHVVTRSGDELDLTIRFTYLPPSILPATWPEGDWCASLSTVVRTLANEAVAGASIEEAFRHPRAASDAIVDDLQRHLAAAGLSPHSVVARLDLPKGFELLRPVPEVAARSRRANPVIFIGLDGADWELLDEYMARGSMPNLAALVRDGSSGPLFTEHPPLSPLLWTSMMTGVSPLDHEILDFTRFNPWSGDKEPITSDERNVPALWNMATESGKRVGVFGLWATYPAEPVRGVVVSDRLFTVLYSESVAPPGIVFPQGREAWAHKALQDSEAEINLPRMKQYLPWLTEMEYQALVHEPNPYEKPGSALRRILVETEVYARLSTSWLGEGIPDLTIVYFQGTDSIGHIFAPYAPPRQPSIPQEEFDRYSQVPERYFRDIDVLLGRYRKLADASHATLMIASDHGFHWKSDRPATLSSFAVASAAKWHRNVGIYLVYGPGITAGHRDPPAAPERLNLPTPQKPGIRQVCATLLALAGLPQDERIAQPPLIKAPNPGQGSIDYRRWFHRMPAPPAATSTAGAEEAIAKLRALGYIGPGEPADSHPASEAAGATRTAAYYNNKGLILKHDGRIADAIAAFTKALSIDPNLASAAWNLSDLLFDKQQELDRADDLLITALKNSLPEATKYIIERAIRYQRGGHAERSLHLLDGAVEAKPNDATLLMFHGSLRFGVHDCSGALKDFQAARQINPNDPLTWASAGMASMCMGDTAGAQESFHRSLALNPDQPMLRRYLRRGR